MTFDTETDIDEIGRKLLAALQADARLSFSALGRVVGLSQPAVAERVRRMEETGLIAGYSVRLDRSRLGLPITAFLRLTCPGEKYQAVRRLATDLPDVLECHHVTGEDCFLLKLAVASMADLERVIDRFREHGRTISSVVLSTAVEDKALEPPRRMP